MHFHLLEFSYRNSHEHLQSQKDMFLANIKFKTETKEMTQNGNWINISWRFTHWNILN